MTSQQSKEVRDYLVKQCMLHGILDSSGNKLLTHEGWDPYIYPDEGYIPYCTVCQADYDKFKSIQTKDTTKAEMEHNRCCIWYMYFSEKIHIVNPDIRIVPTYEKAGQKKK